MKLLISVVIFMLFGVILAQAMTGPAAVKMIGIEPDHYDKASDLAKLFAKHNITMTVFDPDALIPVWGEDQLHNVTKKMCICNATVTTNTTVMYEGKPITYSSTKPKKITIPVVSAIDGSSVFRQRIGTWYRDVAVVAINGIDTVVTYDPKWINEPYPI